MGCTDSGGSSTSQSSTLIKSQKSLVDAIMAMVQPQIGKIGPIFGGDRLAEIDQSFLDASSGAIDNLSGGMQDVFSPIFAEAERFFGDVVSPQVMEQFAAFGGAGSGGAMEALSRSGADLSTQLGSELAPLWLQNQQALPGLAQGAAGFQQAAGQQPLDLAQQMFQEQQPYANPYIALGQSMIPGSGQFAENIVSQDPAGLGASLLTGVAPGLGLGLAMMSDKRCKSEIKTIENALSKIEQLDGKTFQFNHKASERDGGLIAQDIEKVLPEAVKDHNGIKYVEYTAVIALLVNAVKELRSEFKKGRVQLSQP
jgi:hypothetical protein